MISRLEPNPRLPLGTKETTNKKLNKMKFKPIPSPKIPSIHVPPQLQTLEKKKQTNKNQKKNTLKLLHSNLTVQTLACLNAPLPKIRRKKNNQKFNNQQKPNDN
jgi:hypothetical protein